MSDTSSRAPGGEHGLRRRPGWPETGGIIACRPGSHGPGPGTIDERARRLSHQELAIAELLASEGHRVVSLAERRGGGRTPDLAVCRKPVEIKSFDALPDRRGGRPSEWSVYNKLLDAKDKAQAPTVVVNGRGSGLSERSAADGVAEFARRGQVGGLRGVRVVGDDFDLSWSIRVVRGVGVTAVPVRDLPLKDAVVKDAVAARLLQARGQQPAHRELER